LYAQNTEASCGPFCERFIKEKGFIALSVDISFLVISSSLEKDKLHWGASCSVDFLLERGISGISDLPILTSEITQESARCNRQ
jgi:hypothetical protein